MIFSCFTRRSFQNVLQPWWRVYNDFYPVATEVTSNLLSLAWRLRIHLIVGSNDPKPDPKCALSARKCIAQYRLRFQIIPCQLFFWIHPCVCFICFTGILLNVVGLFLSRPLISVPIHLQLFQGLKIFLSL